MQRRPGNVQLGIKTRAKRLDFDSRELGRFVIYLHDPREYVEARGESLLPRRFTVELREKAATGGRWQPTIRLLVEVARGLPGCRAIESRSPRPLTTTSVRDIKLARIVEEASAAIALRLDEHGLLASPARWGGKDAVETLRKKYAAKAERTRAQRRDSLTHDYLIRVAECYRAAEGAGYADAPAKYVARELGISRGKARHHIMRARALRHLGPGQHRRPGELAATRAPRGRALLRPREPDR
jgi:hypothetical protein